MRGSLTQHVGLYPGNQTSSPGCCLSTVPSMCSWGAASLKGVVVGHLKSALVRVAWTPLGSHYIPEWGILITLVSGRGITQDGAGSLVQGRVWKQPTASRTGMPSEPGPASN